MPRPDARRIIQIGWDGVSWLLAAPAALILRYDALPSSDLFEMAVLLGLCLGALQVVLELLVQFFRGRDVIASFDEVFVITVVTAVVAFTGTAALTLQNPASLPRSIPAIAGTLSLFVILAARLGLRLLRQRRLFTNGGERILIYGAGDSGEQIARQMLQSVEPQVTPVGFLDDDLGKRKMRLLNLRVLGTLEDLERVVQKTQASTLVVAISGISGRQLSHLNDRAQDLGLRVRVVPTTSEILNGVVELSDISDLTEEDLLGRRPIDTDEKAIGAFLKGKRVLITGAGGSIGSELVRQVHRYEPSFVGILDRDESAIHRVQLTVHGQALLMEENLILADIRDAERMSQIFQSIKPDIVFHAAALKHLPLLERHPDEGMKTNVLGTSNLLSAAADSKVSAFINVSTDKAADPSSVLGKTKLLTEKATANVTNYPTEYGMARYMSVRFGNVLGSRGSVIETFRFQIDKGVPLTVTDPDVQRYFMTIAEAVHLVLQASVIGEHGETLVLDMGEPVHIVDVARRMIAQSGKDIDIIFTGLRSGEKKLEVLMGPGEEARNRVHPLISHIRVSPSTD